MGKHMNQAQLEKKLKYWQKVLKLRDWNIKAFVTTTKDMPTNEHAGTVAWDLQCKAATICVLDLDEISKDTISEGDMEETLVHELLHLHLAYINETYNNSKSYEVAEEQAINSITKALVQLHRKG